MPLVVVKAVNASKVKDAQVVFSNIDDVNNEVQQNNVIPLAIVLLFENDVTMKIVYQDQEVVFLAKIKKAANFANNDHAVAIVLIKQGVVRGKVVKRPYRMALSIII